MLGQYVNNYQIISLLGEGGMGAVYAAEHRLIGRKVAIKVLKRDLATEPEVVQRFINEARAIGAIRHPNIIEIIDVGKLPGSVPYLVMELLHGESLSERMAAVGPLPIEVAVDFVSQAARALQVAHDNGVVHRDLKPENLFILAEEGRRERLKVLDFGIAKLRDDLSATPVRTRAGSLLGTPLYMSPEQCRGLDDLDLRTDVYSLGVILYEAVCGAPPFLAKSIGEVMRMHMFDAPVPPSHLRSGVPAQIEKLIFKCLAKSPDERFGNMPQLLAALELSGLATTEPDTPTSSFRVSGYEQAVSRPAPSSLSAVAVSVVPGMQREPRDPQQTTRSLRLRRAHASGALQLTLWALVLSLVALGVPDQRLPQRHLGMPGAAELLQLPAAVVIAPLRMAAAVMTGVEAAAAPPSARAARASAPGNHAAARPPGVSVSAAAGPSTRAARGAAEATAHAALVASSNLRTEAAAPPMAAGAATSESTRTGGSDAVTLQPGYLSLDSAPWAEVFLGSDALGTTPLIHVPLPPGRHQLTLRNTELDASTTYVVEIKPGQSLARLVGWGR